MSTPGKNKRNKGGRPILNDQQKRSFSYMLRFNTKEHDQIVSLLKTYGLENVEGRKVAPLLRSILLKMSPDFEQSTSDTKLLSDERTQHLCYEVNKIGNNINQLMRVIHQKNKSNNNIQLDNITDKVAIEMDLLNTTLSKIIQK